MKNVLLLFFIFISVTLYGQTDFRNGKITKLNGDTIIGKIDYQGDIENSILIHFRNQDIDSIYRPFEIKSYNFEKGKFYTSKIAIIDNDTLKIFAEYLVKGKRDLFFNRSKSGFHYLISVSDSIIKELPYKNEIVNIDGVNYQKESKRFVGLLKSYFNDCPSLFSEIDRIKSPERKSLISLTKEYHDITCGDGACIIYDRKEYPINIAIEPVYRYYAKNMLIGDTILNSYGLNLYLWLPNSSERLYFKTGLIFSNPAPYNYFQVPIQFEYVYPLKVIKPKFNFGINAQFVKESGEFLGGTITALVGTGFYLKLTNWMYLDFDINSDLFAMNYETGFFESFATSIGLYIKINKKTTANNVYSK
jgi:hypothetical protein